MEFWKYLTEGKGLFLPEELELPVEDMVNSEKKVSGKVPQSLYGTSNFPFVSSSQFGDTSDQIGVSGSAVESDGLELATIDFKLGVLADSISMGTGDVESSKDAATLHKPTKRAQLTSSDSHSCQVYGCNKDLSSSKGYYKRHKVCEDHTKTAIVIVKGIEQRFCQQCSRFHLLAEFDEGKRSCRKRLAHHNERRRKPRGTRFLSSSSTLPTAFSGPSTHESGKWSRHVKFEDTKLDSSSLLNFHKNLDNAVGTAVLSDVKDSRIPDSSRALSLLSSQSQTIGTSGFHLTGNEDDDNYGSNTSNSKHYHSSGQDTMVDLSQLSSHLQMVEHKRKLMR